MENSLDSTIRSVKAVVIQIPFRQPVKDFRLGKERITDAQPCLVIHIRDSEGHEGWGESLGRSKPDACPSAQVKGNC